ncbi:PEP-CTERM sorting domain-containing protein [Verrucomicrobium sp. BvORR034]|uniref:PEP-CTERM sorting domain-containing protein n=1 Tax=Verrucomicrobium sp. BvORR034 TaxID=1396418 RepID=UPI0006792F3C|nr:PEP-CTERM sorting domain-containing protein [Verrucomicrobium sp. BvORR034]
MTPKSFFQRGAVPVIAVLLGLSGAASAQSIINPSDFYDPDYTARRPGDPSILLSLTVENALYNPALGGAETDGNVNWDHQAGGFAQIGANVGLASVDVQLATFTQTTGNSLVFGRELVTTINDPLGVGALLNPTINALTNSVLGASLISQWDTTATVTGLSLGANTAYTIGFTIDRGAGIDLDALSTARFRLYNNGVLLTDINSSNTLNLLDLLQLGNDLTNFEFTFFTPVALDQLEFRFDATAVADVDALGGISGNQTVMEFTNFAVTPVPEPGSLTLMGLGIYFLVRRRNRV